MSWLEGDLRTAEEHIGRARTIIARQHEIITELEEDGHDAERAKALLQTMQGTLQAFRRHKEMIEEQLGKASHRPPSAQ